MKVVAEGTQLKDITENEALFSEHDMGELRLYMTEKLSDENLSKIEDDIIKSGVILTEPITQEAHILSIHFQKAIAPLLIIVGVIGAIGVGVAGWQLLKLENIPWWVWVGGGLMGLMLLIELRRVL